MTFATGSSFGEASLDVGVCAREFDLDRGMSEGSGSFGLSIGLHGLFFMGVCGSSGNSTVKSRWKGQGVFSNLST